MKPFKLIQGNYNDITKFEDQVAQAIASGYELSGELIVKVIKNNNNQAQEVLLLQPMIIEEHLDFEDDTEFAEDAEDAGHEDTTENI